MVNNIPNKSTITLDLNYIFQNCIFNHPYIIGYLGVSCVLKIIKRGSPKKALKITYDHSWIWKKILQTEDNGDLHEVLDKGGNLILSYPVLYTLNVRQMVEHHKITSCCKTCIFANSFCVLVLLWREKSNDNGIEFKQKFIKSSKYRLYDI